MDRLKHQRLEAAGWKIGSVEEFLKLSPEEAILSQLPSANRLRDIAWACI